MNGGERNDLAAPAPEQLVGVLGTNFDLSNVDEAAARIIAFLKDRMGRLERCGAPHAETVYELRVLLSDIESALEASRGRVPRVPASD